LGHAGTMTTAMKGIEAAQATDVGKVRRFNEDRSLIQFRQGDLVVAVADGVGGEHGGDVASEAAVRSLPDAYFSQPGRDIGRALSAAIRGVNDAVLGAAEQRGFKGAATTLVAAAVRGRRIAIANLGDSRAYMLRGARIRQVTTDHSGSQARSITRFAGDPRGVNPDVFLEDLRPGDRLLLCSDGVTVHLSDRELVPLLRDGDAERAAQRIIRAAVERGGKDNATAVVVAAAESEFSYERAVLWGIIGLGVAAIVTTFVAMLVGD
jgi:serine/threonine protein phosphatase PrpC